MAVLGLDACKNGWVVVVADESGFVNAFVASTAGDALASASKHWLVDAMVIDIPIGIPDTGPRQADIEARAFIGPRRSSVFSTPVRAAVEARTYDEARIASVTATGGTSLSKQAWAITPRIAEVNAWASQAPAGVLVREGHPEVSFRGMAGAPLDDYKKSVAGALQRWELLAAQGIELPRSIDRARLPGVALDDLFDAGALAWTALRVASGKAQSLPGEPQVFSDGWHSAIWF